VNKYKYKVNYSVKIECYVKFFGETDVSLNTIYTLLNSEKSA